MKKKIYIRQIMCEEDKEALAKNSNNKNTHYFYLGAESEFRINEKSIGQKVCSGKASLNSKCQSLSLKSRLFRQKGRAAVASMSN